MELLSSIAFFAVWYLVGIISAFIITFWLRYDYKQPTTYADLGKCFIWGFGGMFIFAFLVLTSMLGFICACTARVVELKLWSDPIWEKSLIKARDQ